MTVLSVAGSMAAGGPLVNRFGYRPVAAVSLVLLGAGCLALTQVSVNGNYLSDIFLGMAIFGPGLGAGFVAASIAALSGVPERDSGIASGLNNTAFQVGGALGIAILSTVVLSNAEGPDPLTAMTEGFQAAFGVSVLFAVFGLLAALALLARPRPAQVAVGAANVSSR
jgi:MFS family permease